MPLMGYKDFVGLFKKKWYIFILIWAAQLILIIALALGFMALFASCTQSPFDNITGQFFGGENSTSNNNNQNTTNSLGYPSGITDQASNCINSYIKKQNSSSPLIGKGNIFVDSGKKYNLNPALLVAISQQESILGTSTLAKEYYNLGGLSSQKTTFTLKSNGRKTTCIARPAVEGSYYITFVSFDESIYEMGYWLRNWYIDKGDDTIDKIGKSWAAGSEWAGNVNKYFNNVVSYCPELKGNIGTSTNVSGGSNIQKILKAASTTNWGQNGDGTGCYRADRQLVQKTFNLTNTQYDSKLTDLNKNYDASLPPTNSELDALRKHLQQDEIVIWNIRGEYSGGHWVVITAIDEKNNISYLDPIGSGSKSPVVKPYNYINSIGKQAGKYYFSITNMYTDAYLRGVYIKP